MKIAIVDDSELDRKDIIGKFEEYYGNKHMEMPVLIHAFESGQEFLKKFCANSYDMLLLDYYLEDMVGMELARKIRKIDENVVLLFVTSSRDFAIESYMVRASGYLVKPFSYEEMSELLSVIEWRKIKEAEYVELPDGQTTERILIRDILYCDVAGHYVRIYTVSMGERKFRMPFLQIAELIEKYPQFLQCYRGCIINMERIARVTEYDFHMENGESIPIRKKEHVKLMKIYSDYVFDKVRRGEHNEKAAGDSAL